MNKRVLLAGLLGGIALFFWGWVSHEALGLGQVGIKEIPQSQEQAISASLKAALPQPGFYFFPGMGIDKNATAQEKEAKTKAFQEKYAQGPDGILIFHPEGMEVMSPKLLGIQFVIVLIEALIAAWLLSLTTLTSLASRVGFVVMIGVIAAIATNAEYWNWYGFPSDYTLAYMADKLIGFLIVGLVVALMTRRRAAAPVLQTAKAA